MRVDHKGIHAPGIESLWRMKAKKSNNLHLHTLCTHVKEASPCSRKRRVESTKQKKDFT